MDVEIESADGIIARCRAEGIPVTRLQLERWHKAGALPHPRQRSAGPHGGSVSMYPVGTHRQVCALRAELKRNRSLPAATFALWLSGYGVDLKKIRAYVQRLADLHDHVVGELRDRGFGAEELPDQALQFVERFALVRRRDAPLLARVRSRVGSRERFETIMRIVMDALAGAYAQTPSPDRPTYEAESEGLLFERALGIVHGRDGLAGFAWIKGEPEETLRSLPKLLSGEWSDAVASATDAELVDARDTARDLCEVLTGMSSMLGHIFEGDPTGIGALGALVREARPFDMALFIAAMVQARSDSEFWNAIQNLRSEVSKVREFRAQEAELLRLRENPEYAPLLTREKLRESFLADLTDAGAEQASQGVRGH